MKTEEAASFPDLIRNAPRAPGVYLMKDAAGEIIYAGKAKDLQEKYDAAIAAADTHWVDAELLRVRGELILSTADGADADCPGRVDGPVGVIGVGRIDLKQIVVPVGRIGPTARRVAEVDQQRPLVHL